MISYIFLAMVLILVAIISALLTRSPLHPAFVNAASFAMVTYFAALGAGSWRSSAELSSGTIILILGWVLTSSLISLIISSAVQARNGVASFPNFVFVPRLRRSWIYATTIYIGIISLLYINGVEEAVAPYGYGSLPLIQKLEGYRGLFILGDAEPQIGIQFKIVQQLRNVIDIIVPLLLFEFMRQSITCKKVDKALVIPLLLGFASSFLSTGRSLFFSYLFCAIVLFYFFARANGVRLSRIIKRLIAIIVTLFILTFSLNTIMSRDVDLTFFDYISFYFGSGITSLDYYLQSSHFYDSTQTFDGLLKILETFGLASYTPRLSEWITYGSGDLSCNIYTCIQRYYADGGVFLALVLGSIYAAITTFLYEAACRKTSPIWLIIYAQYFAILFNQTRDDAFYSSIFRISFPILIVALAVLCKKIYGGCQAESSAIIQKAHV